PGWEFLEGQDMSGAGHQHPLPVLPPGWEERQDNLGRTYYVNHESRTTQWHRPTAQNSEVDTQRRQDINMEAQHAFIARRQISDHEENDRRESPESWEIITDDESTLSHSTGHYSRPPSHPLLERLPACEELGNMHISGAPPSERRPSQTLLPSFPGLPAGWEEKLDNRGRRYFVNHKSRVTTWTRPLVQNALSQSSKTHRRRDPNPRPQGPPSSPRGRCVGYRHSLFECETFMPA
ncbi:hypothetical protein CRUP_005235, partial [Coryphaenoides rupestris]